MTFIKVITGGIKVNVVAILLFLLLFSDGILGIYSGVFSSGLRMAMVVLRDPGTQWMVFVCIGIYAIALLIFNSRTTKFLRLTNANLWLAGAMGISAVLYVTDYSPYTQALTLLGSVVLGHGIAGWVNFESGNSKQDDFRKLVVFLLAAILALASLWHANGKQNFHYHEHVRLSGPWDNPNIFGLFMGIGICLMLGISANICRTKSGGGWLDHFRSLGTGGFIIVGLCFISAAFMIRGLLCSYSRGAFLGTICGIFYLLAYRCDFKDCPGTSKNSHEAWTSKFNPRSSVEAHIWFLRNGAMLAAMVLAISVLLLWHIQQMNWEFGMRLLSAVDSSDFSWRNRIDAWKGALQITTDHPWFGAGWSRPERLYEEYYLPTKLSDGAAIQMNDYLMFGATLGIPALVCFGMYLWLSLIKKTEIKDLKLARNNADWLRAACYAGVIVLLVGFWFDGGLFKLPTAATFWILMELGTFNRTKRQPNK